MTNYKGIKRLGISSLLLAPMVAMPIIISGCSNNNDQYTISVRYGDQEQGCGNPITLLSPLKINIYDQQTGSVTLRYDNTNPSSSEVKIDFIGNHPSGFTFGKNNDESGTMSGNISAVATNELKDFKFGASAKGCKTLPASVNFDGFDDITSVGFGGTEGYDQRVVVDKNKDISYYKNSGRPLQYLDGNDNVVSPKVGGAIQVISGATVTGYDTVQTTLAATTYTYNTDSSGTNDAISPFQLFSSTSDTGASGTIIGFYFAKLTQGNLGFQLQFAINPTFDNGTTFSTAGNNVNLDSFNTNNGRLEYDYKDNVTDFYQIDPARSSATSMNRIYSVDGITFSIA